MPTRKRQYKAKITHRARKLVQNVAQGMTAKQAAIQAGYSPKNASQSAHQVLSRLEGSMSEIMSEYGLTPRGMIENYLLPLLGATRPRYFQYKGKVKDKRQEAALEIRRDALDMAFRLAGSYAPPALEQK